MSTNSITEMMASIAGAIEDSGEGHPEDILFGKATAGKVQATENVKATDIQASPVAAAFSTPTPAPQAAAQAFSTPTPAAQVAAQAFSTPTPTVEPAPKAIETPVVAPVKGGINESALSVNFVDKLLSSIDALRRYDDSHKTTAAICKFLNIEDKNQEAGVLYRLLTISDSTSQGFTDLIAVSLLTEVEQVYSLFELDTDRLTVMCELLDGVSSKKPEKIKEKNLLCREVQTSIMQIPKEALLQLECISELIRLLKA